MEQKQRRQRPQTASPGEAVYGLGLIGALVWYWQQAQSPGERAVSVLKSLVWPAFLVHDALKALHRLRDDGGAHSHGQVSLAPKPHQPTRAEAGG